MLRYRNRRPMGRRRYDTLSQRIRTHLSWAAALQFSVHWLRHTTLTWIEREFGVAIAHAYAGHTSRSTARASTTFTYITPSIVEIAEALSALTGEPHPLSRDHRHPLAPR